MKLKTIARPSLIKTKAKKQKKLKKHKDVDESKGVQSMDESVSGNMDSPSESTPSVKKKSKLKKKSSENRKKSKGRNNDEFSEDQTMDEHVNGNIMSAGNNTTKVKDQSKLKTKSKNKKKPKEKKVRDKNEIEKHKQNLENLKDIDPEFYKFLKQNDKKLLEFNFYDTDDEEDEEVEKQRKSEQDDDEEDLVHKPIENLEVASDESDFEGSSDDDEAEDSDTKVVTLKLLRSWQTEMEDKNVSIAIIRKVIQAFSSALAGVTGDESKSVSYKVDGSAAFNGVVQLCVLHLQPAVHRFLGITPKSKRPIHKCNKWKKIRSCLRSYLLDLTRLLEHVSSTKILLVLLKHLHQLSSMVASFFTISKPILKRLIVLWSTSDDTVRVLSFLCILKITRNQQGPLLTHVLKTMYMSYVRNSKFVSPNTLPGINFMRRSLVEMFALDLNVSYQHVFLFIRQLAIHLRNAIVLKKKESFQAVYNWQFINSIRLWSELLGTTSNKPQLQPLIYPLVSIVTGVIKLIPTAQFFPLRFHCIQALISFGRETNTFIPVMPFLLEVLNSNTFNKKHTVVSMKPMQFTCILRLNKSQMAENGFRDEVVENIFGLTLEYLANESCSLAFPDLIVPTVVALKQYLKVCKNSNHSRKLKQLLDKIMENSNYIEAARRKITFGLNETNKIKAWETIVRNKGVPLDIYYQSWVKTHETKKKRQAANTDDINDYDLPMIKRRKVDKDNRRMVDGVELFPSDDEEDLKIGENDEGETKPKRQKRDKKKQKKSVVQPEIKEDEDDFESNEVDIVKDLDLDDW